MQYDIAVVGGGPAGMMAAGRAAELGARVLLLEKNKWLGSKLLITGKGRCNITQAEFDLRKLVETYGKNGKFLFSALNNFGVQAVIDFFESRGVPVKFERGGRVFPVSDEAKDVLKALEKYLKNGQVEIQYGKTVKNFRGENGRIDGIILADGMEISANEYILCTGGRSYPGTGSTGDGLRFAADMGHTVVQTRPALVPLKIADAWIKDLQGLSLKNVEISLWQKGKKVDSRFGEMLFTHFGVSGPIVLDISKKAGELLKNGEVKLAIDLKPALSEKQLDERVQRDFNEFKNKQFKNALDELLPQKMIPVILAKSEIDPEKKVNVITKDERKRLVGLLKHLEMKVAGTLGFEMAIVTTGGVDIKEVDPKTMNSKIIKNLYLAGEILDVDGPTGGYNLQVAWSTGYLAGQSAASS